MIASNTDLGENGHGKGPGSHLPVENPCLSYWQKTTRAFPLLNANSESSPDNQLPATAKYVVIGSGISGALTAFELLEASPDLRGEDVVILEAREAASGASSRNAGHVRPDSFRGFVAYSRLHGVEQAKKIIANEKLVLERVDAFVAKHNVPCDFNLATTFDVCMTPEFAAYEAECFTAYQQAGGDVSHVKFYAGEEAKRASRVESAITAYEWPAGSSHPAKLAQWLLQSVVERGARLFTHCPALSVVQAADGVAWKIETARGEIETKTVIHCTNAHASFLLPQLSKHVIPNRAQAHSVIPTSALAAGKELKSTLSLRYSLAHFYSVIQRKGDGTIILGVSRSNPTLSEKTLAERINIDDRVYNQEIADDAMKQWKLIFNESEVVHGEGIDHSWTGVIAMTPDSVPYVGAIESLPGQFICAGFNGHGMARIFTSAPGVVKVVLGKSWQETGLPECFQITEERLSRLVDPSKSVW
ncbi:FAD dependent oxidoreductase [Phlyctema vagabunda]|uniref:FAD dependent oxidoreductase n=1 Tax=Phlyctema vagabunda TaxID=108571 RepID=A0ABR4P9S9_9HELO